MCDLKQKMAAPDEQAGADEVAREVDAEWCMVASMPGQTITLAETDQCICATPCGNFKCEARVCPASGSMKFVFCESCSDYMCECNIYGHNECDKCEHVCDCAMCLQLSRLTSAEAAVEIVQRLGASGEFGSLRAAHQVTRVPDDEDMRKAGVKDAEPFAQGGMICVAATAASKETVDAKCVKDEQYSPETAPGVYSPSPMTY